MVYDRRAGVIIFTILVIIALLNTLYITPLAISDSDFSTYIVVPLIMLPLFAFFMMKEKMVPDVKRNDIIIGIILFAILAISTILIRSNLSYLFVSLHIEMLLFPLLIASLAVLLFGFKNINRFKAIMIYSLFASPILLLWLSSANTGFVVGNTLVIYGIISHIFANAAYAAPVTIIANGYSIGIGSTCVGIGILIGIVMFLVPLAYLYDGKLSRKILWITSGFGFVLLLNTLRMLGIAIAWFAYGPSNAILTIHLFAGVLLFYISIIVMILLAKRYGLTFPMKKKEKTKRQARQMYTAGILLAVIITALYYLLSSSYSSAAIFSPILLYNHVGFNASNVNQISDRLTNESGFREETIQDYQQNYLLTELSNSTFNQSNPISILVATENPKGVSSLAGNAMLIGKLVFLNDTGFVQTVYYFSTKGGGALMYNEVVPYVFMNGSSTAASIYAILPANRTPSNITCYPYYSVPYSAAINLFNVNSYNATADSKITSAYCIVQKLVN